MTLTKEEQTVYDLIRNSTGRITQLEIARAAPELGSHAKHEGYIGEQSTLRKIRQIVRDLRLSHKMQILSDNDGYFIKRTPEDAAKYIEALERKAKASAKSFMVTYHEMSRVLGVKSDYFDTQMTMFQ